MSTSRRAGSLASILGALVLVLAPAAVVARGKVAKNGKDIGKDDAGRVAAPPGVTLNACGCYRRGNACVCTNKNAKCECLDDCEPVGCDEKRQKEMDREIAAEVKRAEEQDRKREADEKERARKAAEAQRQEQVDEPTSDDDSDKADPKVGDKAGDKTGDRAGDKAAVKASDQASDSAPAKPSKPSHRDKKKK